MGRSVAVTSCSNGAQTDGTLVAKNGRELYLRIRPALVAGPQPFQTGVGQSQFLAAAVSAPGQC